MPLRVKRPHTDAPPAAQEAVLDAEQVCEKTAAMLNSMKSIWICMQKETKTAATAFLYDQSPQLH